MHVHFVINVTFDDNIDESMLYFISSRSYRHSRSYPLKHLTRRK